MIVIRQDIYYAQNEILYDEISTFCLQGNAKNMVEIYPQLKLWDFVFYNN